MPELILAREARQDLEFLLIAIRDAVAAALSAVAADPASAGKHLVGRLRCRWSARVGNYRVLYTVEGGPASPRVIVRAIRHRAVAYRRRR